MLKRGQINLPSTDGQDAHMQVGNHGFQRLALELPPHALVDAV